MNEELLIKTIFMLVVIMPFIIELVYVLLFKDKFDQDKGGKDR